jgi:predicted acetyltransferase
MNSARGKIKLVKLSKEYKDQLFEMMDEWCSITTNDSPWAIFKNDYHDFDYYLENLERKVPEGGYVPDSTFFALDIERNIFVGAVNIRHYLSDYLLKHGGHVGDGIRPSERRKGFATEMIRLALEECKKLGIDRVLMVCNKDNVGSRKSIIYNGGILENEVYEEEIIQRYWIENK